MLPKQSPAEGDRGDRPDEPVNWAVSEGDDYYNWVEGGMDPEALSTTHHVNLSDALALAKKSSHQGVAQYVWPHPAPEGEREAIAVAIGSELYFRRSAQPTEGAVKVVIEPSQKLLAAMAMQGMLAADTWDGATLAQFAVDTADDLIAALEGVTETKRYVEKLSWDINTTQNAFRNLIGMVKHNRELIAQTMHDDYPTADIADLEDIREMLGQQPDT